MVLEGRHYVCLAAQAVSAVIKNAPRMYHETMRTRGDQWWTARFLLNNDLVMWHTSELNRLWKKHISAIMKNMFKYSLDGILTDNLI